MSALLFLSHVRRESPSYLLNWVGGGGGGGGANNTCRMATMAYTPKDVGHGSSTQYALVKAPGHCNGHPTLLNNAAITPTYIHIP